MTWPPFARSPMFSQYSPSSGFQLTSCVQVTPFCWAILAHVSVRSTLSWYGWHTFAEGIHTVPDVGKSAQKPWRPLAANRGIDPMPFASEMDRQLSLGWIVYTVPAQVGAVVAELQGVWPSTRLCSRSIWTHLGEHLQRHPSRGGDRCQRHG